MATESQPTPAVDVERWPLPKKGARVPPEAITLEHDEFKAKKKFWKFARESDELTGGYEASTQTYKGPESAPSFKETYLIPHIKESDPEMFARRVAAARPPRFVKEGIESIVGVLTEEEPNREEYPPKTKKWTSGVTITGASFQEWVSTDLWPLVERYGLCYSYARRPSVGGANLKEQEQKIKDAGLPEVLLHVITPENLPWWNVDDLGQFEILRYVEQKTKPRLQDGYAVEDEAFTRHWWLTLEGWWYTDENKIAEAGSPVTLKVEAVGTWNTDGKPLKHFPVVKWNLKDDIGPTETAAYAMLMYFRKESELGLVEESSAFSMTWVPISGGDEDPEETVKGPHQIGGYDAEAGGKPMLLETTGVALTHFSDKRLPQLEADASAPYGINDSVAGANDSGVALAHIQEKAKSIFRDHSKSAGQSEFAAIQPVAELFGEEIGEGQRAKWPTKFGTLADASQGELLTGFKEAEPGAGYEEHILRKWSKLTLELTPEQEQNAIDIWETEREEMKTREQDAEDALNEGDGELRRAQVDKTDAETGAIKKPFAAKPASAGTPRERG